MARSRTDGKTLVIVESPAKAKTINKYLGDEYAVKASLGHVRDLPPKEFGIDVNNDFEPTYEIVRGRSKAVNDLRKIAAGAPEVYLATDLDREGEAIAWHLAEALELPAEKVRRVIFNEITRTAVAEAFAHPHQIDRDRVNAQQARRILDRIVGYELSPLLWRKIAKGLSAGRVQSVAVRLIVEREREIRAFAPVESWKLVTYLAADPNRLDPLRADWQTFQATGDPSQKDIQSWLAQHGAFRAELVELGGEPLRVVNAQQAQALAEALGFAIERVDRRPWEEYRHLDLSQTRLIGRLDPGAVPPLTIAELTKRQTTSRPPAPFTTASLQQQASTALRFSASRTMRIAQSLYEGVDLAGEGPVGLITYMRTDSTNLSGEAVGAARDYISEKLGAPYLPETPNVYTKRQQRAQEAHEAIRPTDPRHTPELVREALSEEQFKLYDLIWKRFIACQMTPAQWESTTVNVTCETRIGTARLAGSGRKLAFDGYLRVAGISTDQQLLPALEQGQAVGMIDLDQRQQFTSPPPRYNEASLVKVMESEGIGRPSTYAAIIDTIQARGYVEQEERKFYPTALGELVTDKLVQHFPRIMNVKFTSDMEDALDQIEEAHRDWVRVLHEFYTPFREMLATATDEMETARSQPSDFACPLCEAPMVYRWSKAGRFLACTAYPRCRGTLNVDRAGQPIIPKTTDHACELCQRPLVLRQARSGHFLGCSGYPECRHTIPCNQDGEPLRLVTEDELKRPCDMCADGQMVVKRKGRRAFLGCSRYPECKHTESLPEGVRLEKKPTPPPEPAGIACDRCGQPMVVRTGSRGPFVACSGFPRCRHTMAVQKAEELKASGAATPAPTTLPATTGQHRPWQPGDPAPPGFALTRTGRPVVEVMPEPGTLACPQCGNPMELKRGRFGPFFSCTTFPKCRFNSNLRGEAKKQAEVLMPAPAKPKPIPTDIPCTECGKPMVIREGRRGKFLGCSGYPTCRATGELPPGYSPEAAQVAVSSSASR